LRRHAAILRNENLVADAPPGVVEPLRPGSVHLPARAVDEDLAGNRRRGALGIGSGLDARAHQHIAARPSFDAGAAIAAGIDAQLADRGDGLLPHLAIADTVAIIAAILAG